MKKFLIFLLNIFFINLAFSESLALNKIKTMNTGSQPKQVLFSPDNKYLVLPLLDDKGFRVINTKNTEDSKVISPPNSSKLGFAEGLFIPEKNAFFVSQMTTGNIYEYSYPGFEYKRTLSTGGTWSKFIAWNKDKNLLAVSNWVSNNVSIIEYDTGKIKKIIPTGVAPRGISFLSKGEEILVACYDGGQIQKFQTSDGKKLSEYKVEKSAMRHIVLNSSESKAYISDMYHFTTFEFDVKTFTVTRTWKVHNNPNTICLLNDRYLFVSSRGRNNPEDYTKRSPENGILTVIDVIDGKELLKVSGGNQPTGLDISTDGKFLCSSNFQDDNCDLYEIIFR
ncbi:MAG: YVTN family beta-propeller repeat-containing protein [Treponema sp.]|nr:YVTN family beta-propeller repeat-containing protein [Treponema sp.]